MDLEQWRRVMGMEDVVEIKFWRKVSGTEVGTTNAPSLGNKTAQMPSRSATAIMPQKIFGRHEIPHRLPARLASMRASAYE